MNMYVNWKEGESQFNFCGFTCTTLWPRSLSSFNFTHKNDKSYYFSYHCKLTRRRRSNSINITVTTLWPRFSSMSDYSHKCRKRKFIQLHLNNSKHFCSSQYLFNKKSYVKKHIQFQYYLHFTLVWNVTFKKLKTFLFFSVLFKKKS